MHEENVKEAVEELDEGCSGKLTQIVEFRDVSLVQPKALLTLSIPEFWRPVLGGKVELGQQHLDTVAAKLIATGPLKPKET